MSSSEDTASATSALRLDREVLIEWDTDKSRNYGSRRAKIIGTFPAPGGSLPVLRLGKPVWVFFPLPRSIRYLGLGGEQHIYKVDSSGVSQVVDSFYSEVYGVKFNPERFRRKWPRLQVRLQPRDLVWLGFGFFKPV
jgi:hypothetical protein